MIPAETIMDADYADNIALLANTPTQTKSLLHSLEQAAGGTSVHVDADKMEYMYFNQKRKHLHTKWLFSETSGQVDEILLVRYLPHKQYLIN